MNVHQIERHGAQQSLERPADVERKRRGSSPRPTRQGNALANRKNSGVLALQQSPRTLPSFAYQLPRLTNRGPRLGRSNDQNPMATPSELLGRPADELIDLMPLLPRMRTDLRNGKRLAAHAASLGERATWTSPWPLTWTSSPSFPWPLIRRRFLWPPNLGSPAAGRTWR